MRETIKESIFVFILFLFLAGTASAQQTKIHGTVTSSKTGKSLPAVNIGVPGTSQGTTTNAKGKYTLTVPSGHNTLVFSYIGYKKQKIKINGRSVINVTLKPVTIHGQKLVVVGYGKQQERDITGSISSVSGSEVSKVPTSSALTGLEGKVAGVNITPSGGAPNSQPIVRIRGVGTLNNASPLYVVDGTLTNNISFLNPDNIKSFSILKDASAEAIYGSRGANGVIIITTKHGRPGHHSVSAHAYYGVQRVSHEINMANARQFAMLANESRKNAGGQPAFQNPSQFGKGTDWQQVIFDNMAPKENYTLSASGGNKNYVYDISGSYFKQNGVVRGSGYQRVSLRLNNKYFLSDHVTVGHNISFNYNDQNNAPGNLAYEALKADPTLKPRNKNGGFTNTSKNGGDGNPAAELAYNHNHGFGYRTVGNAFIKIDFLKNLQLKSSFNLDFKRHQNKNFNPVYYVSPIQQNRHNSLTVMDNNHTNWYSRNTLRYKNNWKGSRLKVKGGLIFQKTRYETLGGRRINFPGSAPNLYFLNAGQTQGQTNTNTSHSSGKLSYFIRTNYSYKNRYLVTATFRADGSSRFGPENRFGYFPSLALGWRLSQEPFFNVPAINNLKFRASYGEVGNDKINSNAAIPLVNSGLDYVFGQNQQVVPGATITALANPGLQWEVNKQLNVGLNLGLFNNRFQAKLDYYHKKTSKILTTVPIPPHVGAGAPVVNAASVLNRGFDLNVSWQDHVGNFTYNIKFTGSTVHNEVLSLGKNQNKILSGNRRNLGFTTRTAPGHPIGSFYGYKIIGVIQNKQQLKNTPTLNGEKVGDNIFADTNGDGSITPADKVYLGSPIPKFTAGLNLSVGYKNLDLSASFNSQFGNKILNARRAARGFRLLNYPARFLKRWHGPGTSHFQPRLTEGSNYHTDQFLQSGNFVKLHNIQLGYTFPAGVTNTLQVSHIRVYVDAENPFTITNYTGYSPQIANNNVIATGIDDTPYPIASTYTFGVQLKF
ncbi:MAG TPA: TonB-dependent receptor [Balneolaceae bacterium]|nr:TonB-dependent receptor [Balneolaceae bacterium]